MSVENRSISVKSPLCNTQVTQLVRFETLLIFFLFPRNFSMTLSYNYFTYAKHLYIEKNGDLLLTPLPDTIVSVPIGVISKKVKSSSDSKYIGKQYKHHENVTTDIPYPCLLKL